MIREWGDLKRLNNVRQAGLQFIGITIKEGDLLDMARLFPRSACETEFGSPRSQIVGRAAYSIVRCGRAPRLAELKFGLEFVVKGELLR